MRKIGVLFGFKPGVTLWMWLRLGWLCVALSMCETADDASLWVVFGVLAHLGAAVWAVYRDRGRWKAVVDQGLNSITNYELGIRKGM